MIEQIARRIITRIRDEVSAFIDESGDHDNIDNTPSGSHRLISDVRDHLGKLIAEDHQTQKDLSAAQEELAALQAKIELAISSDREDLARAAFIRRNGLNRQIERLTSRLKDIEAESLEVEELILELSGSDSELEKTLLDGIDTALRSELDELEALAQKLTKSADKNTEEGG